MCLFCANKNRTEEESDEEEVPLHKKSQKKISDRDGKRKRAETPDPAEEAGTEASQVR